MFELVISINCFDHVLIHRVRFEHYYEVKAQQKIIMELFKKLVDDEVIESVATTIK